MMNAKIKKLLYEKAEVEYLPSLDLISILNTLIICTNAEKLFGTITVPIVNGQTRFLLRSFSGHDMWCSEYMCVQKYHLVRLSKVLGLCFKYHIDLQVATIVRVCKCLNHY